MIECEKKIMLSEQEYVFIRNFFQLFDSEFVQKNYYYDTLNLDMNKSGITCRIREKNHKYSVEIKQHNVDWDDVSIENCESVHKKYNDSFFRNIGLFCYGELHTERKILNFNNIHLMLDKNLYLGTVDYELEIEYQVEFEKDAFRTIEMIEEALICGRILNCKGEFVIRVGSNKNKSERFFERTISRINEVQNANNFN